MKKSFFFSILTSISLFFIQTAKAQVVVIIDEDPQVITPTPVYRTPTPVYRTPAPVYRTPAPVYRAPRKASVIPAPSSYRNLHSPILNRWILGYGSLIMTDDYAVLSGGEFSLQYLLSRDLAIEGTIGGGVSEDGQYSLFKTSINAIWYINEGFNNFGISWYLKGGLAFVAANEAISDLDYSYNDRIYTTGDANGIQFGGGIVWKPFTYLSFKMETMLFFPDYEEDSSDDYENNPYDSGILTLYLGTAVHF